MKNLQSPQPMNQAQSLESLQAHAAHKPVSGDHNAAASLLAAAKSITGFDSRIAELQSQRDELPAQEAALAADRSKSPAAVRAGLAVIKDRNSDLRFEQNRLEDDKAKTFSEAFALLPKCQPLISGYFNRLYQAQKAKAVSALAPFFAVGATTTPDQVADDLPTVRAAYLCAIYSLERVHGENAEETFQKYCEVIAEFGLDKPQAA